jgi:two-component system, NtrC family, nitrogen regulation sensor histidine kinase NtrY
MVDWFARRSDGRRALPPDEVKRRRREAILIAITGLAVVVFAIFEIRLPHLSQSVSPSGSVTFFLLINLNLILLVLLIFLVARNLAKLMFERRRGILGSRLRTRLVGAFVGLSIIPAVLLFLVAEGFLTTVMENWFSGRVERSLHASRRIAESYYQKQGSDALRIARELARRIEEDRLLDVTLERQLRSFVADKQSELNIDGLQVVVGQESVASSWSKLRTGYVPPAVDLKSALLDGSEFARTEVVGEQDLIRAGAPIRGPQGGTLGAVVVSSFVPRDLGQAALQAVRSDEEYRRLSVLKQPIHNGYMLSFLLVTLVVLFSATWFGFRLAKGITVPIQRLGEGMHEVAQGRWSHRVEVEGDEEMATLVESFNHMTADLETIHSALEERRHYIENILENIAAGVVSIDAEGKVVTVNPPAAVMLGLDRLEGRDTTWQEVFQQPELHQVRDLIARVSAGDGENIEQQIELATGSRTLTAWVTATTLTDENGARRGIILFFEDVTHLLRVERMEAWREVARRIAHEIKNPLTPIQLSAQRLRRRHLDARGEPRHDLVEECTRTIIGQVDQLKRLVDEFSTFARLPAVRISPSDLNETVNDALVLFRGGHREIRFDFRPDPALPLIEIDRDAIKRAVINMLDNAVAACSNVTNGGAVIEVTTECDEQAGVARIEVADNGCGMAPGVKARAFEPYFSTKRDGTGLGLAIVSAIVADHRAYIRVRDNTPHGTRLVIEFPLRESRSLSPATSA